jgi:hypothetical protein
VSSLFNESMGGMAFLILNQGFSLNGGYAKSHQEIVHLLITVYKNDKINYLHK